jgi:hypothetical protein
MAWHDVGWRGLKMKKQAMPHGKTRQTGAAAKRETRKSTAVGATRNNATTPEA